jgi:hypothetical protein
MDEGGEGCQSLRSRSLFSARASVRQIANSSSTSTYTWLVPSLDQGTGETLLLRLPSLSSRVAGGNMARLAKVRFAERMCNSAIMLLNALTHTRTHALAHTRRSTRPTSKSPQRARAATRKRFTSVHATHHMTSPKCPTPFAHRRWSHGHWTCRMFPCTQGEECHEVVIAGGVAKASAALSSVGLV